MDVNDRAFKDVLDLNNGHHYAVLHELFWKQMHDPQLQCLLSSAFNPPIGFWILSCLEDLTDESKISRLLRRVVMDRTHSDDTVCSLRLLISIGVDINNFPALVHLCITDQYNEHTVNAVNMLLDAGADPNGVNAYNTRVLNLAVLSFSEYSLEIVRALIAKNVNVNRVVETLWNSSNSALTSIFSSVYDLNQYTVEIIRELIQADADVNHGGRDNQKTALMSCCSRSHPREIIRDIFTLLVNASDVNVQDVNGKTALHHMMYSCRNPEEFQVDRVRTLLNARADVTIKSRNGETAGSILDYVTTGVSESKHVREIRNMLTLPNLGN